MEREESGNKRVVSALYEALNSRDVDTIHRLLAPELEWWFHGPPSRQHMMPLLTGNASPEDESFLCKPLSIVAFGSTVLVEGYDEIRSVSWVHAWSVTDGIITQLREYLNTFVMVTRLGKSQSSSHSSNCQCLWQSKLTDNTSVPNLVLAL